MSKKQPATEVVKGTPGFRFQVGHPRYAGRQKRTAAQARALADQLGIDPLDYMLRLLTVDVVEEVEITTDGTERKIKVPVSHETKIEICKALANFFYPRLNATQVTGRDEGPIELARANTELERAMMTPEGVEAVQKLALLMAQADTPPAPARILPPADEYREHR